MIVPSVRHGHMNRNIIVLNEGCGYRDKNIMIPTFCQRITYR